MNNKEKREYISDLLKFLSQPFLSEFNSRKDFLKLTPTTLYKYKSFDEHTFEMIEGNYAYLAPVKGLDDPFDCLNDFTIRDFYNEKTHKITPKAVDFIIKLVCPKGIQNLSVKEVKKLALQCIEEDGIDYEKAPKIVTSNGAVTKTKLDPFFVVLKDFNENFERIMKSTQFDGFASKAMNPGDSVGVCSLSEIRDNKVMWSLYGDNYNGYCIEYDVPKCDEITPNLCPVIYTKRNNNRFIEKMVEHAMASFMCTVTDGHVSGNIGASMELFCTKDRDWSYQQEWRIIGKAGAHCTSLKIKSIYLGFRVSETNESKIKELSKEHKFSVYKMNPPNGNKKITYTKIS